MRPVGAVRGAALTVLAPLTSRIAVRESGYAWRVEEDGKTTTLFRQAPTRRGMYEARAHVTTTPAATFALDLYVFATEDGDLRAVQTSEADYLPQT
jgi:hypothetical protein